MLYGDQFSLCLLGCGVFNTEVMDRVRDIGSIPSKLKVEQNYDFW